jgi:alpha-beta hydrolase superfamily lysophospholipase
MTAFEELTIPLPDGYAAYARYWAPAAPQGAVLYHHGIQSHCGWYEGSAAALCGRGWAVLQVDRRGSGRNRCDRGHAASAEQLIEDSQRAADVLTNRSGFGAYHLLGVSWGGKLAVAAYISKPDGILSLSLVAPGLFPRIGVSPGEMARIGFAMLHDRAKRFDIPLNDAELFTADPKWQHFIATEPLTLRQCTAGFYLASRRMDRIIASLPKSRPVPIHLMLASDERIIDNDATVDFIRGLGWPQCRITRYDDSRHSLEFESTAPRFYEDLAAFLIVHGR